MVITPTLRGLFGISVDAQAKTITVNPRLPAGWDEVRIKNLHVGGTVQELELRRDGGVLTAHLYEGKKEGWKLRSDEPSAENRESYLSSNGLMIAIPLPDVQIQKDAEGSPIPGDRSRSFRVLSENYGARRISLTVEGLASRDERTSDGSFSGQAYRLRIIRNKLVDVKVTPEDGVGQSPKADAAYVRAWAIDTAHSDPKIPIDMFFHFPPGEGWKTITVTLSW
jgi:hypothetical protein